MRSRLVTIGVALALLGGPLARASELPQLHRDECPAAGTPGEVHTVLSGSEQQIIPLHIIGQIPGFAGPGLDLILARLDGDLAAHTGVAAGMSGSPVWVNGELLGALSYRIGSFTREPIAGITPIRQMLAMPRSGGARAVAGLAASARRAALRSLLDLAPADHRGDLDLQGARNVLDESTGPSGEGGEPRTAPGSMSTLQAQTPLAVAGFHPAVLDRLAAELGELGLVPAFTAASAGPASGEGTPRGLQAGDPLGVVLLSGDALVAATGTVTAVDGDRVLAFGHPFLRIGEVSFPMARAEVIHTVPSESNSFKIARVGEIIGVIDQDRATGIAGRLGATARMWPVSLELRLPGETRKMQFEVVPSAGLTAPLVRNVVASSVLTCTIGGRVGTVHLGGQVRVRGHDPLLLDQTFASDELGLPVATQVGTHLGAMVQALVASRGGLEADLGFDLVVTLDETTRVLEVREILADRTHGRAGERVTLEAHLENRHTRRRETARFELEIPDLPAGTDLSLLIGDAPAMARDEAALLGALAGGALELAEVLRVLRRLRPGNRLYARTSRPSVGLLVGGELLEDLPPSVAAVMGSDSSNATRARLNRTGVDLVDRTFDAVVVGSRRLRIRID